MRQPQIESQLSRRSIWFPGLFNGFNKGFVHALPHRAARDRLPKFKVQIHLVTIQFAGNATYSSKQDTQKMPALIVVDEEYNKLGRCVTQAKT